jgi:hypothetical protein
MHVAIDMSNGFDQQGYVVQVCDATMMNNEMLLVN